MFASMFGITRSPARRRWLAVAALCAAGIGLRSVTARAHEVGTTRVSVLFPEGRTYDIEIVTDASALVEKLEASAGRSLPADAGPARLQALLPGLEEIFRRRVKVVFDGAEVRPTIAYAVTPAVDASSAIAATIRLTGEIPKDARLFAWTFAWTFTSYAMTVESAASENPPIQWLEGDQTSAPFDITSVPRVDRRGTAWRYLTLGVMRIVPGGLDHMLFVICICLLGGRARSVLWQVGAFTVAHSIMLALGMCGVVAVQPKIVEPLIALSIAYVALENIFLADLEILADCARLCLRTSARDRFCRRAQGRGAAALGISDGVADVQHRRRGGAGGRDRRGVRARRMALRQSRLVPLPHRRAGVRADRLYGGLLDDRPAALLSAGRVDHLADAMSLIASSPIRRVECILHFLRHHESTSHEGTTTWIRFRVSWSHLECTDQQNRPFESGRSMSSRAGFWLGRSSWSVVSRDRHRAVRRRRPTGRMAGGLATPGPPPSAPIASNRLLSAGASEEGSVQSRGRARGPAHVPEWNGQGRPAIRDTRGQRSRLSR